MRLPKFPKLKLPSPPVAETRIEVEDPPIILELLGSLQAGPYQAGPEEIRQYEVLADWGWVKEHGDGEFVLTEQGDRMGSLVARDVVEHTPEFEAWHKGLEKKSKRWRLIANLMLWGCCAFNITTGIMNLYKR